MEQPPYSGEIVVNDLPGDRWVVALTGDHDLSTAGDVRERLEAIFRTGTSLVVDLQNTTFLDSSILAVLLNASETAEASPCEHFGLVVGDNSPAARLMELTGVTSTFTIFPSVEEALASFSRSEDAGGAISSRWTARETRIVKNEQTFRDYNNRRMQAEPIEATDDEEMIPFICECGDSDCVEALMITAAQFTEAHSAPNRFLVRAGHVYPDVERVVASNEGYAIVEKLAEAVNKLEPQSSG